MWSNKHIEVKTRKEKGKEKGMEKKIVYVDMDGVLTDFGGAVEALEGAGNEGPLDEVEGWFLDLDPLPGAIAAFHTLAEKYDVYILSTGPWNNPSAWSDKLLWVKKHLPELGRKRLILSHNKHLNAGDYLIDDRLKNGAEKFTGELLHFGTEKYPDWKSVLNYLM